MYWVTISRPHLISQKHAISYQKRASEKMILMISPLHETGLICFSTRTRVHGQRSECWMKRDYISRSDASVCETASSKVGHKEARCHRRLSETVWFKLFLQLFEHFTICCKIVQWPRSSELHQRFTHETRANFRMSNSKCGLCFTTMINK